MKSILAAALALSIVTSVNATACLSNAQAKQLADNFGTIVESYSAKLVEQTFTQDFVDYNSGVASLMNLGESGPLPLLGKTFSSRAEFNKLSSTQPSIPFNVQQVWHNCDYVFFRWISPQKPQPVVGINAMQTRLVRVKAKAKVRKISLVYAELNSAAWMIDLGILIPNTNHTQVKTAGHYYENTADEE